MYEQMVLLALVREGQRQVARAERYGWPLADARDSKRTASTKRWRLLGRRRRPESQTPLRTRAVTTAMHDDPANELPAA